MNLLTITLHLADRDISQWEFIEMGTTTPQGPYMRHGSQQSYLSTAQAHLVATLGEFVGTFLFLYFAYAGHLMAVRQQGSSAVADDGPSSETIVFISIIYSFS